METINKVPIVPAPSLGTSYILELEKKIDKGIISPVSTMNHKEIFHKLRKKYPCTDSYDFKAPKGRIDTAQASGLGLKPPKSIQP